MLGRLIGSLCMIIVLLYSAVALSEVVPDTGAVTASTTPEGVSGDNGKRQHWSLISGTHVPYPSGNPTQSQGNAP